MKDKEPGYKRNNNTIHKNLNSLLTWVIPVLVFFTLWEIISRLEIVNPLLFPPPSVVWEALKEWYQSGELIRDVNASYWRMLTGFLIGGTSGAIIGIFTGRVNLINKSLTPIIQFFRPLPPVAIIPLVIVWLGIGDIAKIFSISFAVFFPVWINTHLGASSISTAYLWSAKLLCKSKVKEIFKVLFPAALPSIVAGLRTAIAIAFIMVYVSEIAGASKGLGYQISVSHLAYRIDKMIAALIVLSLAGVLVDYIFSKLVRLIFPWTQYNE